MNKYLLLFILFHIICFCKKKKKGNKSLKYSFQETFFFFLFRWNEYSLRSEYISSNYLRSSSIDRTRQISYLVDSSNNTRLLVGEVLLNRLGIGKRRGQRRLGNYLRSSHRLNDLGGSNRLLYYLSGDRLDDLGCDGLGDHRLSDDSLSYDRLGDYLGSDILLLDRYLLHYNLRLLDFLDGLVYYLFFDSLIFDSFLISFLRNVLDVSVLVNLRNVFSLVFHCVVISHFLLSRNVFYSLHCFVLDHRLFVRNVFDSWFSLYYFSLLSRQNRALIDHLLRLYYLLLYVLNSRLSGHIRSLQSRLDVLHLRLNILDCLRRYLRDLSREILHRLRHYLRLD